MARYTDTQEISFGTLRDSRVIVATGGDVTVEVFDGLSFVPTNTVITDGESSDIITRGLRLRFSIDAGSYYIEDGENR